MFFFAKIRPESSIYKMWKQHSRLGGVVDGAIFRWDGKAFASMELTEEQVDKFRARQDQAVQLEIFANQPPMMEAPLEEHELATTGTSSTTEVTQPADRPRQRARQRL